MWRKAARLFTVLAAAVITTAAFSGCSVGGKSTPDIAPHLISTPDPDPERPIYGFETAALSDCGEEFTDAEYRARVDELYRTVVDDRRQPVFKDNDPVRPIYDAAIEVLDKYVLNSWHGAENGEFAIVHTIHDYLVYYIDYDFALYDKYAHGNAESGNESAFGIDGVFLEKRAVCDGLSRAVSFLCAIEGIDCMRVTGSYAGVAHAWNKVNIGGKWYNLDVTADSANYTINDENSFDKQLSHGFFLLSDRTFKTFDPTGRGGRLHIFEQQSAVAEADYDFYDGRVTEIGGTAYSLVVRDADALNRIFDAIGKSKGEVGKIELRLDFPTKENVNNGDVYADEIAAAYSRLKNSDFSVTSKQKPYFQYPNGVYLFLMYL